jgi:hypothetical protein
MDENIIDYASDYIYKSCKKTACISGGRRPFLFIKKALSQKYKKAFEPPFFFTNEDFVEKLTFENTNDSKISDIEAAYILFNIVKEKSPSLLPLNKSFASFLDWAFEILRFIEQLDMEDAQEEKIKNIQMNADIGYQVPESINDLLKNIFVIRQSFHNELEKRKAASNGYSFLQVSKMPAKTLCGDFEEIILLAPFYMRKTEFEIFKKIFKAGKLTIIIHGAPSEYETLKKIYNEFGVALPKIQNKKPQIDFNVFSAYDDQTQAVLVKNLLSAQPKNSLNKTAVILPDESLLQPMIAEITSFTNDYNVSMGYPISKTALYSLIKAVFAAQLSRNGGNYYAKDIMAVLANPLVKNMRFFASPAASRAIAHGIENLFSFRALLEGRLFLQFDEIYKNEEILDSIDTIVAQVWKKIDKEHLIKILKDVFDTLFVSWEKLDNLQSFGGNLISLIDKTLSFSIDDEYKLNLQCAQIILDIAQELQEGSAANAKMKNEEAVKIILDLMSNKKIALPGSPLNGLQILGLLESRSLSFENIYIASMSDSAIPAVKKEYPLIPKDISFALGIEFVKKDYEIQKYHFERIIAGAKNINFIYPDNEKDERSRFIEKLLWQKQLESNDINAVKVKTLSIAQKPLQTNEKKKYEKTEQIKKFLKDFKYSYSSIDLYLKCPLQFYFAYVLGLDENIEIGADAGAKEIGTFLHEFFEGVFPADFESGLLKSQKFHEQFLEKLNKDFDRKFSYKMKEYSFLVQKILEYRMKNFLEKEANREFESVYKSESACESSIDGEYEYKLKCKIDRIDKRADGKYVIIDFKTGFVPSPLNKTKLKNLMEKGYNRHLLKQNISSLQIPIYKYIFESKENKIADFCGFYNLKDAELKDYFVNIDDKDEAYQFCLDMLVKVLDEINSGSCFQAEKEDLENCKDCKFFYICR